jgi:hypothetical protein
VLKNSVYLLVLILGCLLSYHHGFDKGMIYLESMSGPALYRCVDYMAKIIDGRW